MYILEVELYRHFQYDDSYLKLLIARLEIVRYTYFLSIFLRCETLFELHNRFDFVNKAFVEIKCQ